MMKMKMISRKKLDLEKDHVDEDVSYHHFSYKSVEASTDSHTHRIPNFSNIKLVEPLGVKKSTSGNVETSFGGFHQEER